MDKTYTVVGDSVVVGKSKGDTITMQVLEEWPANIPALIEGGHIQVVAGGDSAPADPAPVSPDAAPQEG